MNEKKKHKQTDEHKINLLPPMNNVWTTNYQNPWHLPVLLPFLVSWYHCRGVGR